MTDDTTFSFWTESADRGLATGISRKLGRFSSETRGRRRLRKLREELVREHIESSGRPRRGWIQNCLALLRTG